MKIITRAKGLKLKGYSSYEAILRIDLPEIKLDLLDNQILLELLPYEKHNLVLGLLHDKETLDALERWGDLLDKSNKKITIRLKGE